MNLKDARGFADYFTGKTSDGTRQLAFAGIAVIWLLRVGDKTGGIAYSNDLFFPLLAFVGALAADLLQYVYAGIAWSIFHRVKENQLLGTPEAQTTDFLAPRSINWPTIFFYYSKIILTVFGFVPLLVHIAKHL